MSNKYMINFYEWFEANNLQNIPQEEAFRICLLYLFNINMYQIGETSHTWSKEGLEYLKSEFARTCEWKKTIENLEVKQ